VILVREDQALVLLLLEYSIGWLSGVCPRLRALKS
jgi:hypothetical protein